MKLQLVLFSAIVAVALCAPTKDSKTIGAAVKMVVKMHKLHEQGLVSQEDMGQVCTTAEQVLGPCKMLGDIVIPGAGQLCHQASNLCGQVSGMVDSATDVVDTFQKIAQAVTNLDLNQVLDLFG